MDTKIIVRDEDGHLVTLSEVLNIVNADRSGKWTNYIMADFNTIPMDVLQWLPEDYTWRVLE
jgi:hypothetical protein